MGLSASQGRLLMLTGEMSNLGFQAQQISNSKMRLSAEGEEVQKDYSMALDKKKYSLLTGVGNDGSTYKDMDYNLLTGKDSPLNAQYGLSDNSGRLLVTKDMADKFVNSASLEAFLELNGEFITTVYPAGYPEAEEAVETTTAIYDVEKDNYEAKKAATATAAAAVIEAEATLAATPPTTTGPNGIPIPNLAYMNAQMALAQARMTMSSATIAESVAKEKYNKAMVAQAKAIENFNALQAFVTEEKSPYYDYCVNMYNRMADGYVSMGDENNTLNNADWLQDQIRNGCLRLEKFDAKSGKWCETSISGNINIVEKNDDRDLARVKAKYDQDMSAVSNKDKKFDLELKNIDLRYSATKTEIESVQEVIKKNIDRSFKYMG